MTPFIVKQPTKMRPTSAPPETRLALTLYNLAHGCSFPTVGVLFGVSQSLASFTFNKVFFVFWSLQQSCAYSGRYDDYVKLLSSSDEWETQLRRFIENYHCTKNEVFHLGFLQ